MSDGAREGNAMLYYRRPSGYPEDLLSFAVKTEQSPLSKSRAQNAVLNSLWRMFARCVDYNVLYHHGMLLFVCTHIREREFRLLQELLLHGVTNDLRIY
jgi:hypothetical protein